MPDRLTLIGSVSRALGAVAMLLALVPSRAEAQIDFRGYRIEAPAEITSLYPVSVDAAQAAIGTSGSGARLTLTVDPSLVGAPADARDAATAREAFQITRVGSDIRVRLASPMAAPPALATIETHGLTGVIYRREGAIERPAIGSRGVHMMLRRLPEDALRRALDVARRSRMNMLILDVGEGVRWDAVPGIALPQALTKSQLNSVLSYARGSGLEIVLGAKLLTHQEKLLKNTRPELLFNSVTLDPRRPEAMAIQKAVMDEIVATTGVRRFLIGHDEVAGVRSRNKLRRGEPALPPELYYENIRQLAAHNRARGVETWMWADMLLVPADFPQMRAGHLHAMGAYEAAARRESLPTDIVMLSWHYQDTGTDFSALSALVDRGFRVYGATWQFDPAIRNMSAYVRDRDRRIEGMLATSWFNVKRRFDLVQTIFQKSGAAYWGDQ